MESVMDRQVGGDHYKDYKIQPYEFFLENQIPHHKAAIIRRILRYDHPTGGGLEDLQKIKHEVDMIIELECWESSETPVSKTRTLLTQVKKDPLPPSDLSDYSGEQEKGE